jgi:excisionase family DNA binding protein
MATPRKTLSVAQTAALCGVGRSTVGYWIRSKRLGADRTGRNYSIPCGELLFFLKSTGRNIPDNLADENILGPCFRTFQNCWHYWKDNAQGRHCERCAVLVNRLEVCFTAKKIGVLNCPGSCHGCRYYTEIYLPRIQFVHQIELPAAVCKGFEVWGGNRRWAELCEVEERDLPGTGIEQVVHPDSIETVISSMKKRALGDPSVPRTYSIFLRSSQNGRLRVRISVYLLREPVGSYLVLAEPNEDESEASRSIREDEQWH